MSENLTKRNISEKLLEMLKTKPVDKITVKNLAEACCITRQTFYYHFHDILDVMEWGMEQKMRDVVEETMHMEHTRNAFYRMLSGCREDMAVISHLMESHYRAPLERMFVASVRKYLQEMVDRKKLLQQVSKADVDMTLKLYSYALTGFFSIFAVSLNRISRLWLIRCPGCSTGTFCSCRLSRRRRFYILLFLSIHI